MEIKSNNKTSQTALAPGVTMTVGGPGETKVTIRSRENKALCKEVKKQGK